MKRRIDSFSYSGAPACRATGKQSSQTDTFCTNTVDFMFSSHQRVYLHAQCYSEMEKKQKNKTDFRMFRYLFSGVIGGAD